MGTIEKSSVQSETHAISGTGWVEHETESQSGVWSEQKSKEKLSMEDAETIQRYMEVFIEKVSQGSIDKALFLYREIIDLSHNSPIFTGGEIGNKELADRLVLIEKSLKDAKDSAGRSKLFLDKGITEYAIGNHLYYSDAKKYRLAVIYYWLLATESFDQSNEFNNNALAHRYKWVAIMDIGSPTKLAIEELNKAIDLDNQDAISYYKLGNAYRQTEQYNLAIENYLKGLRRDNKNELMRLNLWIAYFDNGEREKWYQTYKDLLQICNDFCHVVNFDMAIQTEVDGKHNDTMVFLDRAIEFAKLKMVVYRNAYRKKGQALYLFNNTGALENLKMSLNDPNDPAHYDNNFNQNDHERDTYYYIGKAYIALKDYNNADMYLDKANTLFPGDEGLMRLRDSIKSFVSK